MMELIINNVAGGFVVDGVNNLVVAVFLVSICDLK